MAITPQSTFEDFMREMGYQWVESDDSAYWRSPDPQAEGARVRPGQLENLEGAFREATAVDPQGRPIWGSLGWTSDTRNSIVNIGGVPYVRTGWLETPEGYWVREWLGQVGLPESEFGRVSFYHPEYGYVTHGGLVDWQRQQYARTNSGTFIDKFLDAGGGVFALAAPIAGAAFGIGPLAGASTLGGPLIDLSSIFGSAGTAASGGQQAIDAMAQTLYDRAAAAGIPGYDVALASSALGYAPVTSLTAPGLLPGTTTYLSGTAAGTTALTGGPMSIFGQIARAVLPGGVGGESSWLKGLLDIGTGLYGLYRSNRLEDLARMAFERSDPFGPHRAQYASMLAALMADPRILERYPGYQAGLQAVNRGLAASGYLGSGNQMTALLDYGGNIFNQEAQRLALLAGAQIAPSGAGDLLRGYGAASDLANAALQGIGYGISRLPPFQEIRLA